MRGTSLGGLLESHAVTEHMRISIITAVYNNVTYIAQAIESVLSQDYPWIEHVLIDGGSTDGTLDAIEPYRDQISVILSEPDEGIYDALNKGIRLATGDIIGLLHSDDLLAHQGVISLVANGFDSTTANVLYGDLEYVLARRVNKVVRYWDAGQFTRSKLAYGWMPPHPTVYARREVYERLGDFDCSYWIAADYDWILRVFGDEKVQIKYLPEVVVKMRLGGVSNRSLSNILRKSKEDYLALKRNRVGGLGSLFLKNIIKLPQFFVRN